jgi:hypothetical protein
MGLQVEGFAVANGMNVDAANNARVNTPGYNSAGVAVGGGDINGPAVFSEVDSGTITAARRVLSPEVDDDYRFRVATDTMLDEYAFLDVVQNTAKFKHDFLTLTATASAAGLLCNSGAITTTTTGMTFGTFAMFPCGGTQSLITCQEFAMSAQPSANQVFDIGPFQRGAANPFLPLDGAYFRISAAGVQGVVNFNGTETSSGVFTNAGNTGTFAYANNQVYHWLIQANALKTTFWINNILYAEILTPIGQHAPFMSRALPWSLRDSIVGGAAGSALQPLVKSYQVYTRGAVSAEPLSAMRNRVDGSYQRPDAAVLGSLGTYANSTNPTAAVPSNTTLTVGAAGLLNQAWETFSLAVNTDALLASYQVPAGSATVPGRRLKVMGVKLSSYVQTVLVGGPCARTFGLAFGGTAVSLAQGESASFATGTTKARRVVLLPELTQIITAAQVVSTMISQPQGSVSMFPAPVYVNPGEFVQVFEKIVGTVGTSGTIVNHIQIIAEPE